MLDRTRWVPLGVGLLIVLSLGAYVLLVREPGIDEVGGKELRYRLDLGRIATGRADVAAQAGDVILRRLRAAGYSAASVTSEGVDSLTVRVPWAGATDVPLLRRLIETRNALSFRLVAPTEEQDAGRLSMCEEEEAKYVAADTEWVRRKVAEPGFAEPRPRPPELIVRSELERTEVDGSVAYAPKPNGRLSLDNRHVLDGESGEWRPGDFVTGEHLSRVRDTIDPSTFRPAVAFQLTKEGAKRFGELTEANIGRRLAIVLDDNIMQVAVIRDRISERGQLSGDFTRDEVRAIVTILASGSLPARPELVSEVTVEPRSPSGPSAPRSS